MNKALWIYLSILVCIVIPLMGFPDLLFPNQPDSTYFLCAGIAIIIGMVSTLYFIQHVQKDHHRGIMKILRSMPDKNSIISRGRVRQSLLLTNAFQKEWPAILTMTHDNDYTIHLVKNGQVEKFSADVSHSELLRSDLPRDYRYYISFRVDREPLFFIPGINWNVWKQQAEAKKLFQYISANSKRTKICHNCGNKIDARATLCLFCAETVAAE